MAPFFFVIYPIIKPIHPIFKWVILILTPSSLRVFYVFPTKWGLIAFDIFPTKWGLMAFYISPIKWGLRAFDIFPIKWGTDWFYWLICILQERKCISEESVFYLATQSWIPQVVLLQSSFLETQFAVTLLRLVFTFQPNCWVFLQNLLIRI